LANHFYLAIEAGRVSFECLTYNSQLVSIDLLSFRKDVLRTGGFKALLCSFR
jgi:hypothetical protein